MAQEYPTNSSLTLGAPVNDSPPLPPPKAESVISGKAAMKPRKSKGLRNFLLAQDFKDVKEGLVDDVVRPKVRDSIYDAWQRLVEIADDAVQKMIYGEARRTPGSRVGDRVSYNQYSNRRVSAPSSPSMTTALESDDLTYESRGDAEAVLESMFYYLSRYPSVTVANMYEFSDLTPPPPAFNYGWQDLTGATIRSARRDGRTVYIIDLPRAKPLPK